VASVHRGQPEMGLVSRLVGPALCAVVGAIAGSALSKKRAEPSVYTMADQVARFAKAKAEGNKRVLDIDAFYDPSKLAGKRVLVTGANRGIGLALATQLQADGATVIATCRQSSAELDALKVAQVITGIDVTQDADMAPLVAALAGSAVDVVVNNAGYFYGPVETLTSLNFGEQLKQIDICALGPLRVSAALVNAGLVATGGKVVMITSQGGSVAWRDVQNPTGHDYGHHSARAPHARASASGRGWLVSRARPAYRRVAARVCSWVWCARLAPRARVARAVSKSAANMMSALLAKELAGKGIAVLILHPGAHAKLSLSPLRAHSARPRSPCARTARARGRARIGARDARATRPAPVVARSSRARARPPVAAARRLQQDRHDRQVQGDLGGRGRRGRGRGRQARAARGGRRLDGHVGQVYQLRGRAADPLLDGVAFEVETGRAAEAGAVMMRHISGSLRRRSQVHAIGTYDVDATLLTFERRGV
jgi:NAD(P)-dependent dehydrogenase (short-subunit alcohol dehydrogenase family)